MSGLAHFRSACARNEPACLAKMRNALVPSPSFGGTIPSNMASASSTII